MARSSATSSRPDSVGNGGRIGLIFLTQKLQRWAMTNVLSQASGRSANNCRISAAGLK